MPGALWEYKRDGESRPFIMPRPFAEYKDGSHGPLMSFVDATRRCPFQLCQGPARDAIVHRRVCVARPKRSGRLE